MSNALIQIFSVIFTALSAIVVAWLARKSRQERKDDLKRQEVERENLRDEGKRLSAEAAEIALRGLRTELTAAYSDVERRRVTIESQDKRIDNLNAVIRRQGIRADRADDHIRALETWAVRAKARFAELGINGLPPVPHLDDDPKLGEL